MIHLMALPTPLPEVVMDGGQGNSNESNQAVLGQEPGHSKLVEAITETSQNVPPTYSPYKPQFSSVSAVILGRINRGPQDLNSRVQNGLGKGVSVSEEGSQVESPTSGGPAAPLTVPLPTTTSPLTALPGKDGTRQRLWGSEFLAAGPKRQKTAGGDSPDFTANTLPFPASTSTLIGSLLSRNASRNNSGANETRKCSACKEQKSVPRNLIITCTHCKESHHQQCVAPPVPDAKARAAVYLCTNCESPAGKRAGIIANQDRNHHDRHVERLRQKRLDKLHLEVPPAKPHLVGFDAGRTSDMARTEYFLGKKKTDLLNILSLCDQLKPQLLVDVLVSVTKKHPDLPIFDAPDWELTLPSATAKSAKTQSHKAATIAKPRHGHTLVHASAKAKRRAKNMKKILKRTRVVEVAAEENGEDEEEEEEADVIPPTWPKADEGLYSKLVPEIEDRMFLADDNDEESFSHFMVDKLGKPIVEPIAV